MIVLQTIPDSILLSGFIWLIGQYGFSAGWLIVCVVKRLCCAKVWHGRFFVLQFFMFYEGGGF